jgi:hypothetical protein
VRQAPVPLGGGVLDGAQAGSHPHRLVDLLVQRGVLRLQVRPHRRLGDHGHQRLPQGPEARWDGRTARVPSRPTVGDA